MPRLMQLCEWRKQGRNGSSMQEDNEALYLAVADLVVIYKFGGSVGCF
jgi:hypothetical protein